MIEGLVVDMHHQVFYHIKAACCCLIAKVIKLLITCPGNQFSLATCVCLISQVDHQCTSSTLENNLHQWFFKINNAYPFHCAAGYKDRHLWQNTRASEEHHTLAHLLGIHSRRPEAENVVHQPKGSKHSHHRQAFFCTRN
jgi:hypothetical protein